MTARPTRPLLATVGAGAVALGLASASGPPPPGTIQEALGLRSGPGVDLEERRALEVAERTSRCLAELGLQAPVTPEIPPAIPDASASPLEWAERWGFGVSTSVDAGAASGTVVGPGPRPSSAHGRCATAAATAVYGLRDRALAPLRGPMLDLAARIEADPRVVEARQAWRRCIGRMAGAPPLGGRTRSTYGASVMAWFGARAAAAIGDGRALRAVQADERRVAVGMVRCELAFESARATVRALYERAFVERFERDLRDVGREIRDAEAAYPALAPGRGPSPSTETQPRSSWSWMSDGRSSASA